MANPAHQDLLGNDEQELRPRSPSGQPSRPAPPRTISQPSMRPVRRPSGGGGGTMRRVGLFLKILLGDMTIWAVLSGVLTYEVMTRGMDARHALVGAAAGLLVAIAVSIGLKQVANRIVRLNRSALEISRGDLSKGLPSETSLLGAHEVDELSVAIS